MMPRTRTTPPLRDRSVERMSHRPEAAAAKPAMKPSKVAATPSSKVAAAPTSSVSQ